MKRSSSKYFAAFCIFCFVQIYRNSIKTDNDVAVSSVDEITGESQTILRYSDVCKCSRNVTASIQFASGPINWCSEEASLNGFHQNVVAYSLYGDAKPKYFQLLDTIPRQIAEFYPDWRMRVYHNIKADTPEHKLLCELHCNNSNVDLCDVNELISRLHVLKEATKRVPITADQLRQLNERLWRYLPLMDPLVDQFMSRDMDSEVYPREFAAVKEWLKSDFTFHCMRDHQSHCTAIMAGMFGAKVYRRRDLIQGLTRVMITLGFNKGHVLDRDIDQTKLLDIFWPSVKDDAVIHDSYCCERDWNSLETRPFPTQRDNMTFVSGRNGGGWNPLEECPFKCRPSEHKNWIYC